MSNYNIEIKFDNINKKYKGNDKISGTVFVNVLKTIKLDKLVIELSWQTHGLGNIDKQLIDKISLIDQKVQWTAGSTYEFPFSFDTPNGPITYRGVDLNVDWYLKVKIRKTLIEKAIKEDDIILLPSNSLESNNYRFGNNKTIQDEEQMDKENGTNVVSFFITTMFAILGIFVLIDAISKKDIIVGLFGFLFTAAGISFTFYLLRNKISQYLIGNISFKLENLRVKPGSKILCNLQINPKTYIKMNNIKVTLANLEYIEDGSGSDLKKYTNLLYSESKNILKNEYISDRNPLIKEVSFMIPQNGVPTFISESNKVNWRVIVSIKHNVFSLWKKELDCIVCP